MQEGCGLVFTNGPDKNIKKVDDTGTFELKSGRRKKPFNLTAIEDVVTALQEKMNSGMVSCSAQELPGR